MTIDEVIQQLMKHADEYAIECEEWLPGEDGQMVSKKCKKIDVTLDLIVDFCYKYNFPFPYELRALYEVKEHE